ncbi:tyrosine-protein phosphatase [Thermobrachium celere]|uniref:protein-tyrosine-phosphatase n=1 Tax=Thermobrachium celere DSM 8682 TaxID=941824 RepID=R7RQT7_9CLOT|nr:CpsB/CapC family capsule biosynthesis tyrosine phosphatase [Thermobrachium celere]CDF57716.1 Manganese-dependent protein-tyrosine phosphatase [Thermobrachium celere DSM 8682]
MIDIHSHILPGIDDGSKDLETTLKMIEIYKSQGVDTVISTPHFYPSYFENTKEVVNKTLYEINEKLKAMNIDFTIYPGSEVFATQDTLKYVKEGYIQTLNNSRYILMEFDYKHFPEYGLDLIYELHLLGYRVVVAHPERYYYVIKDITFLNELIEEGCLIQINTSSITGLFGREVKKTALKIIENGSFNFIATDAHTTNGRGPYFEEAFKLINKFKKDYRQTLANNIELLIKNVNICNKLNKMEKNKSFIDILKGIRR